MKKIIVLFAALTFFANASAQKTTDILKQQAGEGVREGAAIATEEAANKATDKILNSIFSRKNKKKKSKKNETVKNIQSNNPQSNGGNPIVTQGGSQISNSSDATLQTYSKYDFIPGDKVLVYEDFSKDAIGDFPENWNTNATGETVTATGHPGKWLMLNKKGVYRQEDVTELPDNFTYEYDLIYSGDNPFLQLLFLSSGDKNGKIDFGAGNRSGVDIGIEPIVRDNGGAALINTYNDGNLVINNQVEFHNTPENKTIKISVWRQKQRLRVYVNQEKVFDLPRAFTAGKTYNTAKFELISDGYNTQSKYLISNIKLAVGTPDTRNRLINEGKFSTTGILFDVNSSKIKPESYGTLKDIANVLTENPAVKVKIIGHTDSDGDPANNLDLSKKRAEAVKSFLESEFKIDGSRMQTDGKGETEPVADNKTPAGKAQNRRVEFVKM